MNRIRLFFIILIWGLYVTTFPYAQDAPPLLGDESDGSRAVPVHLIPLLDEGGIEIAPDDQPVVPFSTHQTCALKCHDYSKITGGWHFNALDAKVAPGRPGHPWIYVDAGTGTQIPLSYRAWPGTYKPDVIGMTPWRFVKQFGHHLPGGGVGEFADSANPDKVMRALVSGKLEANCLACHDADPAHDQAEYAVQIARENFRWAAAATSGFSSVEGSAEKMPDTYDYQMPDGLSDPKLVPPGIEYRPNTFDSKKRVFFNIVRKISSERCYFCHSSKDVEMNRPGKWISDGDVHLAAGLACVDCHRNGLDHNIVRGYNGEKTVSSNPMAVATSCEGCHRGDANSAQPIAGRLRAPVPQHRGIPLIHFTKLSCTACHSGPWPGDKTHRVKTSLAHGLGMRNVNKSDEALPHIQTPVLALGADGKIAPQNALWPSFWGVLKGGEVTLLPLDIVTQVVAPITGKAERPATGDWPAMGEDGIKETLSALAAAGSLDGKPVYAAGGKLYQLDEKGTLSSSPHKSAQPYLWPIAHDVRPAAQSLGVRSCQDCHTVDSDFFFGKIQVDSPLPGDKEATVAMIAFQGLNPEQVKTLALSFWFRPWFKVVTLVSAGILILVILAYALRGFSKVMDSLTGSRE